MLAESSAAAALRAASVAARSAARAQPTSRRPSTSTSALAGPTRRVRAPLLANDVGLEPEPRPSPRPSARAPRPSFIAQPTEPDPPGHYLFTRPDLSTALETFHKLARRPAQTPLFDLRAVPLARLAHAPSPFSGGGNPLRRPRVDPGFADVDEDVAPDLRAALRAGTARPTTQRIAFAVVASKAAVSKLAVERNRARTRFKAALSAATRGGTVWQPDMAYLAVLKRAIYDAPLAEIQAGVKPPCYT
ncbi:hypothetical protein Q5752_003015 [Cryptotrichosporon argae]